MGHSGQQVPRRCHDVEYTDLEYKAWQRLYTSRVLYYLCPVYTVLEYRALEYKLSEGTDLEYTKHVTQCPWARGFNTCPMGTGSVAEYPAFRATHLYSTPLSLYPSYMVFHLYRTPLIRYFTVTVLRLYRTPLIRYFTVTVLCLYRTRLI